MYIRDYLRAYVKDWISLMSGAASVAFTFWAIFTDPNNVNLRKGLWIVTALCFIIGSYRVWSKEHSEAHRLEGETEKEINQIVREFTEIKTSILMSRLDEVIAAELKRLKAFLHKYPGLLSSDLGKFYETFIAPKEVHLHYGTSLNFEQAEYKQMKEQLAQIELHIGKE
jgi:hypothetical protein